MGRYAPLLLAFHLVWTSCLAGTGANAAEFYAVVEEGGTVTLCLSKGALLFADRCEGSGRLSIIQPIKEGTVVWRSATGTVALENEVENSQCALSRAHWDQKSEQVVSTGRKLAKFDRTNVLNRLKQSLLKDADVVEDDVTAFSLDLDNDGKEEIVFTASNLRRLADHYSDDKKSVPYFVYAGVLAGNSPIPELLWNDRGDYAGGTDAIGDVTIKGLVPIAPGTGELALLIKGGSGFNGTQWLMRYRQGTVQRIETIEFICN